MIYISYSAVFFLDAFLRGALLGFTGSDASVFSRSSFGGGGSSSSTGSDFLALVFVGSA